MTASLQFNIDGMPTQKKRKKDRNINNRNIRTAHFPEPSGLNACSLGWSPRNQTNKKKMPQRGMRTM